MVVSRMLLALLLTLTLLLLASPVAALVNPEEGIKTECSKIKDVKLCTEVLTAHLPDCNAANVTGVAELSMHVAAKVARDMEVFARAKVAEEAKGDGAPSPCITICVRDICLAAERLKGVRAGEVIQYSEWLKVGELKKMPFKFRCGEGCTDRPTVDEQAITQKVTEIKDAMSVMVELMEKRGYHKEEFPGLKVDY